MSFAKIAELQKLIKTLWESGEVSAQTRMEIGRAIEAIKKERSTARTMGDVGIEEPVTLLESSYEKSSALGSRWIPPWETTRTKPGTEFVEPEPLYPREEILSTVEIGVVKKQKVGMLADQPEKDIPELTAELRDVQALKSNYLRLSKTEGGNKEYVDQRLRELGIEEERLTDQLYGKAAWEVKQSDLLSAYRMPTQPEDLSAQRFVSSSTALARRSMRSIQGKLIRKGIFTQSQWEKKEAARQEMEFIEKVLMNPEAAQTYAKTATPYFFKYWSEKGGVLGVKEHMQALKTAARAEDIEPTAAKWGALTTVKDIKSSSFSFASLRGQVTELWDPTSPKISQVGLFQDTSGEKIKFTIWKNQPNVPKVEQGKSYYFGNVASQEWQGRWNLNINRVSTVEEIEPMPFTGIQPRPPQGLSTDIRDYTKPHSIDPIKGTITYTTKSGKVVEQTIPKVDTTAQKMNRVGDKPGDFLGVAPLPLAGVPLMWGNLTSMQYQAVQEQEPQDQREQALLAVMRSHHQQAMDITNLPFELGGIWLKKGQETYGRLRAGWGGYVEEQRIRPRPLGAPEDILGAGLAALDVLGAALYPLNYPTQALWGVAGGKEPMEGIRQEITPAQVLDIENPLAAFAADITLDPMNLLMGAGLVSKGGKLSRSAGVLEKTEFSGFKRFLADESATLSTPLGEVGTPILQSRDKWLIGGGAALAGAGWAGYELTKKEPEPWTATNTTLPQGPMHPGYPGRSTEFDAFAAYGIPGNMTAMPSTAQMGAAKDDENLFWKALDVLNTVSYAEGAAIDYLKTGEWKGIGAKITPSEALGITPEGEDVAMWRHGLGFLLDIGLDPTTYISFGAGGAVKVAGTGGSKLALSAKGVKELGKMRKTLTPAKAGMRSSEAMAIGEELGTKEFIAKIQSDPAFRKKVLASEGMSLRGWGPFFPGMEKEIVSKETMDWALTAPRGVLAKAAESRAGQALSRRFQAFYDIKKLPRPVHMPVTEAEYVEKFFSYKKKVPYLQKQAVDEASELAKKAKEVLGDDYQEIMAQLIESPVTRAMPGTPKEAVRIAEVIEAQHKMIAEAEMTRGILGAEIQSMGYLKHMLTPEARAYLKEGKEIPKELTGRWATKTGSSIQRGYKGTLKEINEEARKTLGFDLFEPDPFTAFATRKAESIQAVETYDYLEYVRNYYGRELEAIPETERAQYERVGLDQLKDIYLPKPIAEHLTEEYILKPGAFKQQYNKLLTAWKYTQTVPFPPYHAQNVMGGMLYNAMLLGDTGTGSVYAASRLMKGSGLEKTYTTALGRHYTGEELLQLAGEHGVMGQPGMMDIPQMLQTKISGPRTLGEKAKWAIDRPTALARKEEDWMRFTMFYDRVMKGDTPEQAAEWVIKHQFGYSTERYTKFERDYMLSLFPFYKYAKGNVPLQLEYAAAQPGKQLLLPRGVQSAFGEEELPGGDYTGYAMIPLSNESFASVRMPATDMRFYMNPAEYAWESSVPWVKLPVEAATGLRGAGTDFEYPYSKLPMGSALGGGVAPVAYSVAGRPLSTADLLENQYKTPEEKAVKLTTSIGTAQLPSEKERKELFGQQFARPGSTTYEQRYEIWKRDLYMSGSGIKGLQLQTGHIVPAEWGGPAEPWNLITQTYEENMEWAGAQMRRQSLPWRIEQEKEFIRKLREDSAKKLEEIATKKDEWGRALNAAQLEKVRYDRRKSDNLKLYQRLINHLTAEINWVTKELYNEEKGLEEKKEKGVDDPFSKQQIPAMKKLLAKYTEKRDKLIKMKEEEAAKEYELPAQITDLEKFRPMNIGHWDEYTVRYGKGPELAKEEDILSIVEKEGEEELVSPLVSLEELTLGREVVQGAPWAVDYRNLSLYSPQGAELMWGATEQYREVQKAAEPLVKELFGEVPGRPPEAVFKLPTVPVSSHKEYGQLVKEYQERGEPPSEEGAEGGKCRAIDYEDPEFIAAVQYIVWETLSEGAATD